MAGKLTAMLVWASLVCSAYGAGCPSGPNAGFQVVRYEGVKAAVWYPTADRPATYTYSDRISGSVAVGGAPACTDLALLFFSHGLNGCGTQSVFLTEELARRGYIVLAPDYRDARCSVDSSGPQNLESADPEKFQDYAAWTDGTYLDRRDDSRSVLNGILSSAGFGPRIDASRIAAGGHSLGGYTVAAMLGGWSSWKDPRFRTALLLSPVVGPFMVDGRSTLDAIQSPVMYQGGTADLGITPGLKKPGGAYDLTKPTKFLAEFRGAGHFDFSNSVCGRAPTTVAACLASQTNAKLIFDYAEAFLATTVWGEDRAMLYTPNPALATYWRQSALAVVSAASYSPDVAPGSIASLFGLGLAAREQTALPPAPAESIGAISARVTYADGNSVAARLYMVSPGQINLVLPQTPPSTGPVRVEVRQDAEVIAAGQAKLSPVAPGLFTTAATGMAAGEWLRVLPDGARTSGAISRTPIALSPGQVYLSLYGTGFRHATKLQARSGNTAVPILAMAPSPEYAGLDQLALGPLPLELAGKGEVDIVVTADGANSNAAKFVTR